MTVRRTRGQVWALPTRLWSGERDPVGTGSNRCIPGRDRKTQMNEESSRGPGKLSKFQSLLVSGLGGRESSVPIRRGVATQVQCFGDKIRYWAGRPMKCAVSRHRPAGSGAKRNQGIHIYRGSAQGVGSKRAWRSDALATRPSLRRSNGTERTLRTWRSDRPAEIQEESIGHRFAARDDDPRLVVDVLTCLCRSGFDEPAANARRVL
eukprot:scaffold7064_cov253-Pinguiococcus_pyrenoidosus.AAC.2